jgi:transposase
MKKNITAVSEVPERTIGIDLRDRTFRYCAVNREGKIVVQQLGHQAIVANAREFRAVTGRSHRSDSQDARQLARLDEELLNPVRLRGAEQQADLFVIRARARLVEARTRLINFARGITKTTGRRLPSADAKNFAERARQAVPETLRPALLPLLNVLDQIARELDSYHENVQALAEERYPETRWLRQAPARSPRSPSY